MKKYVILGATHTGITLTKRLTALGHKVVLCDVIDCPDSAVENDYLKRSPIDDAKMLGRFDAYFITFDDDAKNIRLCLSINNEFPHVPLYTILTQDPLGQKVSKLMPNFHYINPPTMAAKRFVDEALDDLPENVEHKFKWKSVKFRPDSLVKKAILFILGVMLSSILFFHINDGMGWIDALYFTVTMMATVGFGDYSLKDHSDVSKLFGSLIMLLSVTGTAIIFALVSDSIIRRRKELAVGRVSYKGHNHVLVIGGGSVGYNVVTLLKNRGEKPVMLDRSLDGRFSQQIVDMGVPYLVGDAKDDMNLFRAGLSTCKAIICVTQDDLTNLEVGLDAQALRPDLRIVLRIYDQKLAANLKELAAIKHTLSMSSIAAEGLINMPKW